MEGGHLRLKYFILSPYLMSYINSLAFFQLPMAIKNRTFWVGKAKLENKLQNLMPELGLGDDVNILYKPGFGPPPPIHEE